MKYIIISINTNTKMYFFFFTKQPKIHGMMDHAMIALIVTTYRLSCTIINYYTILNLVNIWSNLFLINGCIFLHL